MAEPIVVRGIEIPEDELTWRFSRSSGPGGQNVNRRDTKAELSFDLSASRAIGKIRKERAIERLGPKLKDGVLTVASVEHRTQARNRSEARRKLIEILHEALAPPPKSRRPTKPSRGAVEARLQQKKRRSERKKLRGPVDPY